MKIKVVLSIMFFILGLISIQSCNKNKIESTNPEKKIVNPNGESDLALLMRAMMDHGKTIKNNIEKQEEITPYPENFNTIYTAKETYKMIDDRNIFNGLAKDYMARLDSIYLPGVVQKKQFNSMVNSCISCHQNYCHGPIPTIKQLIIP